MRIIGNKYALMRPPRPAAVYDNIPTHYGIADELYRRKLSKEKRDQNGINTSYLIK